MAVVTAGAGDRKGRTGQHVCPRLDHCSPPLDTTAVAMSLRVQLTILTSHDLPFVRRRLGSPPPPPHGRRLQARLAICAFCGGGSRPGPWLKSIAIGRGAASFIGA